MIGFLKFFTFQRQIILFAVCFALTILLWALPGVGFAWAWIPLLVVIVLLTKHLLIGTVNTAAMQLQNGDWDAAEKLLKWTFKPEWLQFGYHAMYYILLSRIALQREDFKKAEALANKALTIKMQDDFKAMLYLELISIQGHYQKSNPKNQIHINKMKELLAKAKKLHVSNLEIKANIIEVDMMLKGEHDMQKKMASPGRGGMKSMMQQGFMKRSSKKKR